MIGSSISEQIAEITQQSHTHTVPSAGQLNISPPGQRLITSASDWERQASKQNVRCVCDEGGRGLVNAKCLMCVATDLTAGVKGLICCTQTGKSPWAPVSTGSLSITSQSLVTSLDRTYTIQPTSCACDMCCKTLKTVAVFQAMLLTLYHYMHHIYCNLTGFIVIYTHST